MYEILRHTHGGFRYLLLLAIVLALFSFVTGWTRNRDFTAWDKRAALSVLILSHLQLVTGLVLYFISPSNYPNVFEQKCALCHGVDGDKQLSGAKKLSESTANIDDIILLVTEGRNQMLPFKGRLTSEEIKAVSEYALTFQTK